MYWFCGTWMTPKKALAGCKGWLGEWGTSHFCFDWSRDTESRHNWKKSKKVHNLSFQTPTFPSLICLSHNGHFHAFHIPGHVILYSLFTEDTTVACLGLSLFLVVQLHVTWGGCTEIVQSLDFVCGTAWSFPQMVTDSALHVAQGEFRGKKCNTS